MSLAHADIIDPVLDRKARRKLEDQRRMRYRRAIEDYTEQQRLHRELLDYPELIALNYLLATCSAPR